MRIVNRAQAQAQRDGAMGRAGAWAALMAVCLMWIVVTACTAPEKEDLRYDLCAYDAATAMRFNECADLDTSRITDLRGPVEEDDPRWDCRTMGNQVCGPGNAGLPAGSTPYVVEPMEGTTDHDEVGVYDVPCGTLTVYFDHSAYYAPDPSVQCTVKVRG